MPHHAAVSLLATSGGIPRGIVGALLAAGLAGGAIGLLTMLRPRIRGTTLASPWLWSLAAIACLGLVETLLQLRPVGDSPPWIPAARFIFSALSLCPMVAVLGAKRPQDRAWHFVVLALWGIVSLPSLMSLLLGRDSPFQLADLRGLVLWVLIALPAINYVPTKHYWSAILVVLGQVILFAPHLPLIGRPILATDPGLIGLACFLAAACVAWQRSSASRAHESSFDALWRSFRDRFGLFWGLRVQERVNAAAKQYGWPFYLSWSGFRRADDHAPLPEISAEHRQALTQTLRGLLRRFAAAEWIAARLPRGID
ncbi:MAG TPA: hypothetical protein VMP01_12350 [Pirellulaceae bacterium]|nr:hypothetical protein [Pirellulaceae bacterium]